jgi:hypothetical protein
MGVTESGRREEGDTIGVALVLDPATRHDASGTLLPE